MSLAFLCHLTTAMVIAPAVGGGLCRIAASAGRTNPQSNATGSAIDPPNRGRDRARGNAVDWLSPVAVWMIPIVVLAVNSFWWLPGVWLASTKGPSDFAFSHPEGVGRRLFQIVSHRSRRFRASLARGWACRDLFCS